MIKLFILEISKEDCNLEKVNLYLQQEILTKDNLLKEKEMVKEFIFLNKRIKNILEILLMGMQKGKVLISFWMKEILLLELLRIGRKQKEFIPSKMEMFGKVLMRIINFMGKASSILLMEKLLLLLSKTIKELDI